MYYNKRQSTQKKIISNLNKKVRWIGDKFEGYLSYDGIIIEELEKEYKIKVTRIKGKDITENIIKNILKNKVKIG